MVFIVFLFYVLVRKRVTALAEAYDWSAIVSYHFPGVNHMLLTVQARGSVRGSLEEGMMVVTAISTCNVQDL